MRSSTIIAIAHAVVPALAFTNGSLIPSYICNPVPDGLPKSYGELLPFTSEQLGPVAFNANNGSNIATPPVTIPNNKTNTDGNVGNSAYVLASFHNTFNSLQPIMQGMVVKTMNGGPLVAGKPNQLILDSGTVGVNLDGALLYASSGADVRVGSFTDKGGMGTFKDFPGCGKNKDGQNAGVVHQMIISNNNTYNALVYNVPKCVKTANITMSGLSVTDAGFGVWRYNFAVVGSLCTSTITNTTTTKNSTKPNTDASSRSVEELITIVEEFHSW